MKQTIKTAIAATFFAASVSAFAASPVSITFDSNGSATDGAEYANYLVKCSNNEKKPLTAWNKRKKWCVGENSQENCHKKQIKAAKQACKAKK